MAGPQFTYSDTNLHMLNAALSVHMHKSQCTNYKFTNMPTTSFAGFVAHFNGGAVFPRLYAMPAVQQNSQTMLERDGGALVQSGIPECHSRYCTVRAIGST
jgi:hypothetical protein